VSGDRRQVQLGQRPRGSESARSGAPLAQRHWWTVKKFLLFALV
jgi:hypothetical protein